MPIQKYGLFLFTAILLLSTFSAFAEETRPFKPHGKVRGHAYPNYYYRFNNYDNYKSSSSYAKVSVKSGFSIERARLGYAYHFSPHWASKVAIEAKRIGERGYENLAYLRTAQVIYKRGKFIINGGLFGTQFAKRQEVLQQHRYIQNSFAVEYRFGNSTDFGLEILYQPIKALTVEVGMFNGKEGYKVTQNDSIYKYALGFNLRMSNGFTARTYSTLEPFDDPAAYWMALLGYQSSRFVGTAEYHFFHNVPGASAAVNQEGYAIYLSYQLGEDWRVLGRYDRFVIALNGKEKAPNEGGWQMMAAIEYLPAKGIRIAPNFRLWGDTKGEVAPVAFLSIGLNF